jgi:hypothetical protein
VTRRASLLVAAGAAALLGFALAVACAGTHPAPRVAWDPNADLSPPRTYAWDDRPGQQSPTGDSIVDGAFLDKRIRAAAERELATHGYRPAPPGTTPDILVSYQTGQDGVGSADEWGTYTWWSYPRYVYEGSGYEKERGLTLELRDREHKLLWRGQVSRLEGTNPEAVGREIDREVAELLSRLPVPGK